LLLPHAPLVFKLAEQPALVPPLAPLHVHVHGPLPLTDDAVPVVQRLAVGAAVRSAPLLLPQAPLVAVTRLAEQLAVVPVLMPAQVQFHGPLPLTDDAVPALQRFVLGADVRLSPLLLPQEPLVTRLAEQLAFVPPFVPLQIHVHGPLPLTDDADPVLQRLAVGADVRSAPLLLPQDPLVGVELKLYSWTRALSVSDT
jgi:hypothetical protein